MLAKEVKRCSPRAPLWAGEERDIIAIDTRCGPEPEHGAGFAPTFVHHLFEHRFSICVHAARTFADDLIVKDRREFAGELPGHEERGPVDIVDKRSQRNVVQHLNTLHPGRRRIAVGEVGQIGRQRTVGMPALIAAATGVAGADLFVLGHPLSNKSILLALTRQCRRNAHGARSIGDVDGLAAMKYGIDLDGRVRL